MINLMNNRVKYKTTLTIILLISGLFVLAGCGSGSGGGGATAGGSGATSVSINLTVPGGSGSNGTGPSAAAASAPKPINILEIEISGDGEIFVSEQYSVTSGQIFSATYLIPSGANRTVTIRAFNGSELLYLGESTVDFTGQATTITIDMELFVDVNYAINLLEQGDIVSARDLLRAAVQKYLGESSEFERNANFFYAFTRLYALWYDMESDGVNDGLLDVGDILDAFNCSTDNRDPDNFDMDFDTTSDPVDPFPLFPLVTCPGSPLASGAPILGRDLQDFLYNVVRPELIGAISNLNTVSGISTDWTRNWDEPFGDTTVESDNGDVLVLKAMFKAAAAFIEIQYGYDLSLNINGNDLDNIDSYGTFMGSNPAYFTPNSGMAGYLANAQGYLSNNALLDINDAIDWMLAETVNPDEWIDIASWVQDDIDSAKDNIAQAENCVVGVTCNIILDDNDTIGISSDDTVINLALYFNNLATNINSFLPDYDVDYPIGFLPEPIFGGLFPMLDGYSDLSVLNDDEDGDGTADSLDRNIYYVYGGIALPANPYLQNLRDDPLLQGYELIRADDAQNFQFGPVDFNDTFVYDYYYITSHSEIPTFVDREDVTIDALEFIDTGVYCCEFNDEFWVSDGRLWQLFDSQSQDLDGVTGIMSERSSILVYDNTLLFGTGLRVYGIYP